MINNKNNNSKSSIFNLLAQDGLVNQSFKSDTIVCKLKSGFDGFYSFYAAFHSIYSLKTTKSEIISSFIRFVLFYCGIILSHHSKFVSFLQNKNILCNYPSFVFSYLMSISMQVNTTDSGSGFISGVLKQENDFKKLIQPLLDDIASDNLPLWEELAVGTVFHQIFSDKKQITILKADIFETFERMRSASVHEDGTFEQQMFMIHCFIRDLRPALHQKTADDLKYIEDFIPYQTSRKLGIYRYRNYQKRPSVYLTHSSLEGGLTSGPASQQLAFLKIFSPIFSSNGTRVFGDHILDFSETHTHVAWLTYFSMEFKTISTKAKTQKQNNVQAPRVVAPRAVRREYSTYASPTLLGGSLSDYNLVLVCNRPFPSLFVKRFNNINNVKNDHINRDIF